jgi:hypothetical protein
MPEPLLAPASEAGPAVRFRTRRGGGVRAHARRGGGVPPARPGRRRRARGTRRPALHERRSAHSARTDDLPGGDRLRRVHPVGRSRQSAGRAAAAPRRGGGPARGPTRRLRRTAVRRRGTGPAQRRRALPGAGLPVPDRDRGQRHMRVPRPCRGPGSGPGRAGARPAAAVAARPAGPHGELAGQRGARQRLAQQPLSPAAGVADLPAAVRVSQRRRVRPGRDVADPRGSRPGSG